MTNIFRVLLGGGADCVNQIYLFLNYLNTLRRDDSYMIEREGFCRSRKGNAYMCNMNTYFPILDILFHNFETERFSQYEESVQLVCLSFYIQFRRKLAFHVAQIFYCILLYLVKVTQTK